MMKMLNEFSVFFGLCEVAGIGAAEELKMVFSGIESIELFLQPIKTLGIHLPYHKQNEKQRLWLLPRSYIFC